MGWCCAAGAGAQEGGGGAPATAEGAAAPAAVATVAASGGVRDAAAGGTAARAIPAMEAASTVQVPAKALPADGGERVAQPRGGGWHCRREQDGRRRGRRHRRRSSPWERVLSYNPVLSQHVQKSTAYAHVINRLLTLRIPSLLSRHWGCPFRRVRHDTLSSASHSSLPMPVALAMSHPPLSSPTLPVTRVRTTRQMRWPPRPPRGCCRSCALALPPPL